MDLTNIDVSVGNCGVSDNDLFCKPINFHPTPQIEPILRRINRCVAQERALMETGSRGDDPMVARIRLLYSVNINVLHRLIHDEWGWG